jgi:hypothetical protein
VRRREEERMSLEAIEVSRLVIDEIVRVDDSLVAAEDDVAGRDEPQAAFIQPSRSCRI